MDVEGYGLTLCKAPSGELRKTEKSSITLVGVSVEIGTWDLVCWI